MARTGQAPPRQIRKKRLIFRISYGKQSSEDLGRRFEEFFPAIPQRSSTRRLPTFAPYWQASKSLVMFAYLRNSFSTGGRREQA
jgi:hypothetical protein